MITWLRVLIGVAGILALIILAVAVDDVWEGGTWLVGSVISIGSMIGLYIATRVEYKPPRSRRRRDEDFDEE